MTDLMLLTANPGWDDAKAVAIPSQRWVDADSFARSVQCLTGVGDWTLSANPNGSIHVKWGDSKKWIHAELTADGKHRWTVRATGRRKKFEGTRDELVQAVREL